MSSSNNGLLIALALIERVEPQLKVDKREQLNITALSMIERNLSQALNRINEAGISDTYIIGYLIDVIDCINHLINDDSFVETDTETKEIITTKTIECLENLYLAVGKYYTNRDFDYSIRMEPTLVRIIDHCIRKGYYFGVKVEV